MKVKLVVLLVMLVVVVVFYLWMEQKLWWGVVLCQFCILWFQYKVCGYCYLEEDNLDESDVEGEYGDGVEEEVLFVGFRLGFEFVGFGCWFCFYEQVQGGDGFEEQ